MKVYQLIYTSVQHSLSDPELGLVNQSGLRVFSCTQGLTKQNIDETIRFATYRLPKNNEIKYTPVSYTHLRAHETGRNLVCRLLLEKKKDIITNAVFCLKQKT